MLPDIRQAVGDDYPLPADGGIRNGLDIARYMACGADMVLLGRPFLYAITAMGPRGADHIINVLRQESRISLIQIGCADSSQLARFL